MTEPESSEIALALWSEEHTGSNDLPGETQLFDWVFLLLPEPEAGLAEQRFKDKWLTESNESEENTLSLEDILWEFGRALSSLKKHGCLIVLSEEERCYLIQVIEKWSDTPEPSHPVAYFENRLREPTFRAIAGLSTIISEIEIPESIGEKLYNKMQNLNEYKIPGFRLIAGLIKAIPKRFDDFALLIRTGLASENEDLAKDAAASLYDWLTASARTAAQIQAPPDDLVREIGVMDRYPQNKGSGTSPASRQVGI